METQWEWNWICKFVCTDVKALCGSGVTAILNVITLIIKGMKLIINASKEGPNSLVEVLTPVY
jgi:hypothetical protein